MRYFYRKQKLTTFCWLIALAVVLRSFIAPGYMLSVSADDGLGIIFCNGPGGIYAQHDVHAHHHHDGGGTQHQNHISPTCSFWSTSSLFVVTPHFEPALIVSTRVEQPVQFQTLLLQQFFDTTRFIRGPPSLS